MSTATVFEEPVHREMVQKEDVLVEVGRGSPLVLPDGIIEWLHPEFANSGPVAYCLSEVKPWLHHSQKSIQGIPGGDIHAYLRDGNHLRTCLGYRDALVLCELGPDCFSQFFGEEIHLFFWRSLAKTSFGCAVPKLFVLNGVLQIEFAPIMFRWHKNAPAARFRRSVTC